MFQVKRMVSNMFGGAIELASNDSETVTPALRMRSSASRGSPARPSRNSEWVAHDSGVLVFAISSASMSRAGTKWQSSRFGPSQPRFSKSTVSTQFGGVCAACSAIGSLRSSAPAMSTWKVVRRALRMAAQVEAEMDEPLERGAGGEVLLLDAVDVGEAHRLARAASGRRGRRRSGRAASTRGARAVRHRRAPACGCCATSCARW